MREAAGACRRELPVDDLRHTFATHLADNCLSESTVLTLMGHMSRAMLERYSHVRMAIKRNAVEGVTLQAKRRTQALAR